MLVDAAARWRTRTPPPVVVIAGSGPAYLPLAARISAARAPVTLLGHRTDVADLLAGADLAVVTSDWEARQLFAQEALRAGVPLVATAVGGLPELVGDARACWSRRATSTRSTRPCGAAGRPGAARAELGRAGRPRAATWPTEADTVAGLADALRRAGRGAPAGPAPRPDGTPLMLRRSPRSC